MRENDQSRRRSTNKMVQDFLSKFVCDASLSTVRRSSVAVIGDRVELKCSANGDQHVIWGFTSFNTSKDTDIYFGDDISLPFQSRYRIDKGISGQHNLVIDSVDLDHAGRYQCVTMATDTIPIFSWSKANTEDTIAANKSTSEKRSIPLTTTSSIIQQLHSDENGVTFTCKITFQLPNNAEGNAPDYEYTWNYTANVLYGPRNLSISEYSDRLVCSADGNPTPRYRWRLIETTRSLERAVLVFHNALFSDKERNIECTAVNALGTQSKSIPIFNNESENKTTLSTAGVALTIASLSLAGFVFLGLGLGLRKLTNIFNTSGWFRRSESQVRTSSIQVPPLSHVDQTELPTEELNSPMPADTETEDSQTASTKADYCTLADRPSTEQRPENYCELRLHDQPSADYVVQPPTEHKLQSKDPTYCEIIEL